MSSRLSSITAVVSILCTVGISSIAAADDIAARLKTAKSEWTKASDSEQAALQAAFDNAIKTTAATGKLSAVKELIAQTEAFRNAGTSPASRPLRAAVETYKAGRQSANKKFESALGKCRDEYTRKQEIAKATAVDRDLVAFIDQEKLFFAAVRVPLKPFVGAAPGAGRDEVRDRLTSAKEEWARLVESEKASLMAAFKTAIDTISATANLAATTDLVAQRDSFQNAGTFPAAPALKPGAEKYIEGRRKASETRLQAFRQAVGDYTRNLEIDRATAVEKEMKTFIAEEKKIFIAPLINEIKSKGPFASREEGYRKRLVKHYGGTEDSEKAVDAALLWLSRHQNKDGHWSLKRFSESCRRGGCSGASTQDSDAAATALGLLPFLAAGHTHMSEGKYQGTVKRGLNWLLTQQDQRGNMPVNMYAHGLCTIAVCEAYGMTKDASLRTAAEGAVSFIQTAQDPAGGGWRYRPREAGDTSVVGWQVAGLKSAEMAGLPMQQATLDGARKYLAAAAGGAQGGFFGYLPGGGTTSGMTAVGTLSRQYLGAAKDDPGLKEGAAFLLASLPDQWQQRNTYYWYYATQALHNMEGEEWRTWNQKIVPVLVNSQVKGNGCSAGSWDPDKPAADHWGNQGGRIMITSLSCLSLQIYYRYLPMYEGQPAPPNVEAR